MANRKLIRPNLSDLKERLPKNFGQRRSVPPTDTNAENYYYLKQMNARTPMVVVLNDGEELRGWIEWYDRGCLKVNRDDAPNLLVMKHQVKYLYKQEANSRRPRERF
jgi:sRNA-binding regulator protein Hfq